MKKLIILTLFLPSISFAGTHIQEGSPFTSGQCVQAGNGDTLTTTGSACGSGGGSGGIVSPGTFTWTNTFGMSLSTETITSTVTFQGPISGQGGVGNSGQILASQGNGQPPTFIDPIVSQAIASNLNASCWINGSSNTVTISPSTMTAQGIAQTTSLPTAVSAGAQVAAFSDKFGRFMVSGIPRDQIKQATATLTSTTETVLISSGAAGVFNDLCGCIFTNTSATATRIDLRGQGNGGTINNNFEIPPTDTRGFWPGCQNPFVQLSAASNWTIQLSGGVTDVRITCQYIPLN